MLIFGYYILFFHYPFNSYDWYFPTIWLAGILTIGLVIDILLDRFGILGNCSSRDADWGFDRTLSFSGF